MDDAKKPIDISKVSDPVKAALFNAERFDKTAFAQWLSLQPSKAQKTARLRPPDRIYELKGKLCYVLAYAKDGHVVVRGIGDPDEANVHCAPDELKDVTNELRRDRGLPVEQ